MLPDALSARGKKLLLLVGFLALITLASLPKTVATDNASKIKIPGGEEKSLWDLAVDPYTRYLGGFFHLLWIMTVAGLAWMKTDSIGMPLLWIIISSSGLAGLPIPGTGTVFFVLVAASAVTVSVIRIVVKRETR